MPLSVDRRSTQRKRTRGLFRPGRANIKIPRARRSVGHRARLNPQGVIDAPSSTSVGRTQDGESARLSPALHYKFMGSAKGTLTQPHDWPEQRKPRQQRRSAGVATIIGTRWRRTPVPGRVGTLTTSSGAAHPNLWTRRTRPQPNYRRPPAPELGTRARSRRRLWRGVSRSAIRRARSLRSGEFGLKSQKRGATTVYPVAPRLTSSLPGPPGMFLLVVL